MLSYLIPVYNTDVRDFVRELSRQIEQSGITGEIVCLDDASDEKYRILNREMLTWKNVKYTELEKNVGRSRIRNLLVKEARYDWFIFADSDLVIVRNDFIQKYAAQTKDRGTLVYGGTLYGEKPAEKEKLLHWLYGIYRESLGVDQRNQNKYGTFKTNNFMISRWAFEQIGFDETVKGYGHEDTLFATDASRKGLDMVHIDNPLQHYGVETNVEFLNKQKNAIQNLAILYKQQKVGNEIRLIRFYQTMKKWKLLWLVKLAYLKKEKTLLNNLMSGNPKLGNLDRLKLGWFMGLVQ